MSEVISVAVPPELRSTICPNCGYSLEGLGVDDACPECGRPRDNMEIVLYGFPVGENPATRAKLTSWIGTLMGLAMFAFVCLMTGWYMVIVLLLSIGWGLLGYLNRRHPGVVQVRMLPDGVVQFSHGGMMTSLRRLRARFLWIFLLLASSAVTAWVLVRAISGVGVPVAILWIVMTPFVFMAAGDAVNYRRGCRLLDANAIADCNMALHRVTKWESIRRVVVTPLAPNCHRVQLKKRQRFFSLDNSSHVVDAEVALSNDAATVLRRLLIDRCGGVKKPSIPGPAKINEAIANLKSDV